MLAVVYMTDVYLLLVVSIVTRFLYLVFFFFIFVFVLFFFFFFFSSRRRHTRWTGDWSSDVCSSDLRNKETMTLLDPYLDWAEAQGIPLHLDFGHDLLALETKPWGFYEARGCFRSEERRVGKECRSRWSPDH